MKAKKNAERIPRHCPITGCGGRLVRFRPDVWVCVCCQKAFRLSAEGELKKVKLLQYI